MQAIRKVVIPAAGWGTRFLPATKTVPKEMLPLVDRPVIHYGVQEASASGITRAIVITSQGKEAMETYFKPYPELEAFLKARGKGNLLKDVQDLMDRVEMSYVVQEEQLGLGHAVLTAARAVGTEPFAVLLPDDVILSDVPTLAQLIEIYSRYNASVLAVERVPKEQISSYGIVDGQKIGPGLYKLKGLVEKPRPEDAPSDLAIVGRYILTPGIFDALRNTRPGAGGEIQVTDGIARLLKEEPVYAYQFQGTRLDIGTPLGLIEASIAAVLRRPDLAGELREFLDRVMKY